MSNASPSPITWTSAPEPCRRAATDLLVQIGEARPCADGRRDPTGIEVVRVFVGNQQGIRADRCIWRAENSGIDDDRNAILLDTHPRMSERRHLLVLPVCRRTAGGGRRGLICLRASRGLKEGRRGRKRSDHSRATPEKNCRPVVSRCNAYKRCWPSAASAALLPVSLT